jgi:hypothetical protein
MMRTPLLIEISVMGFFFGKILCRGHAVVFFKNPVKIRNALETTGLADDRERIAALFHLVYGMTEAKLINIFSYKLHPTDPFPYRKSHSRSIVNFLMFSP